MLCRLAVDARQATPRPGQRAAALHASCSSRPTSSSPPRATARRPRCWRTRPSSTPPRPASRQAEIALAQVNIRAPFAGVFDHRDAEIGTYLSPGQPCGTMIELEPAAGRGRRARDRGRQAARRRAGHRQAGLRPGAERPRPLRGAATPTRRPAPTTWRSPSRTRGWTSARASRPTCASARARARRTWCRSRPWCWTPPAARACATSLADDRVAFAPVTIVEETPRGRLGHRPLGPRARDHRRPVLRRRRPEGSRRPGALAPRRPGRREMIGAADRRSHQTAQGGAGRDADRRDLRPLRLPARCRAKPSRTSTCPTSR